MPVMVEVFGVVCLSLIVIKGRGSGEERRDVRWMEARWECTVESGVKTVKKDG